MEKIIVDLVNSAIEARKNAYVRYSHFQVGAAVLCDDGSIYTGCNVENASYGATICAERVAITKAVSEGKRRIIKIAIVGGPAGRPVSKTMPCGICRQFLSEFGSKETEIILASTEDSMLKYYLYTLGELLPEVFSL